MLYDDVDDAVADDSVVNVVNVDVVAVVCCCCAML